MPARIAAASRHGVAEVHGLEVRVSRGAMLGEVKTSKFLFLRDAHADHHVNDLEQDQAST